MREWSDYSSFIGQCGRRVPVHPDSSPVGAALLTLGYGVLYQLLRGFVTHYDYYQTAS